MSDELKAIRPDAGNAQDLSPEELQEQLEQMDVGQVSRKSRPSIRAV